MDIQTKLLKFRNLNIKKYLNETLPRYEKSVILADKNHIERVRKDIDTEIFKSFLLNSDSLLEVLYTYESVKSSLNKLDDVKADLRKLSFNLKSSEDINFVDRNRLEEFRNILNNFSNDTEFFDTGSRVLVHFEIFYDQNDNKNIFILTNDILIIGKIDPQIRKYQLVNAFSYSIIDVQINNEDLFIILSQSTMKYRGDKNNIDKFYSTFKDLIYSYSDQVETTAKRGTNNNLEVLEYLVSTEQYESIEKSHVGDPKNLIYLNPRIFEKNDVFVLLKVIGEKREHRTSILTSFLTFRFSNITEKIDKVMGLRELIDHIFDIFYLFNKEQQALLKEIREEIEIDDIKILMMLEKQILMCFKLIEVRIFNKRYYSDDIEGIMNRIREKLVFDGLDFSYLTDYFVNKKKHHEEECFRDAKKEIDAILNEMICN